MSNAVQNFFTIESFATFGGASLIVLVLTNTYRKLTKQDHAIIAFLAAELVAFVGAYEAHSLTCPVQYFVAALNGCLLFCSALGINETATNVTAPLPPPGSVKPQGAKRVKWLSSWYKSK